MNWVMGELNNNHLTIQSLLIHADQVIVLSFNVYFIETNTERFLASQN
jgi:hypothetical protein